MDPTTIEDWAKVAGVSGIGGLLAIFFTRFIFRKLSEEGAASQRAGAETDIIEHLRREVDRLSGINEALSNKVTALQEDLILLRGENAKLKTEIQHLNLQLKGVRDAQRAGK